MWVFIFRGSTVGRMFSKAQILYSFRISKLINGEFVWIRYGPVIASHGGDEGRRVLPFGASDPISYGRQHVWFIHVRVKAP